MCVFFSSCGGGLANSVLFLVYRKKMQHRAYQPLLPAGNKYLQQKWDNASYDLHRKKVRSCSLT